jgi:hypothetical protein
LRKIKNDIMKLKNKFNGANNLEIKRNIRILQKKFRHQQRLNLTKIDANKKIKI